MMIQLHQFAMEFIFAGVYFGYWKMPQWQHERKLLEWEEECFFPPSRIVGLLNFQLFNKILMEGL